MKLGDLVKPNDEHLLKHRPCRASGVVVKLYPETKGFNETLVVLWNDGECELEIPKWLEVISETR